MDTSTDTALILVPGLRPPVPSGPGRLGKSRPVPSRAARPASPARLARLGDLVDLTVAWAFALIGVVIALVMASPLGSLIAFFFLCRAYHSLAHSPAAEARDA